MDDEPISKADIAGAGWHLDRRIPLVLILTILVQSGAAVWWASNTDSRLAALEAMSRDTSDQSGRIIRNETRIEILANTLTRIEDKLDRALRDQIPIR